MHQSFKFLNTYLSGSFSLVIQWEMRSLILPQALTEKAEQIFFKNLLCLC